MGEIDGVTLPERGPRELRRVTDTLGEVVANVRLVEAQVGALAAGQLDDAVLERPVPGRLGTLLHESVRGLSNSLAERQELARRLQHEATHDALTGLPNRAAAAAELARALGRARRAGTSVGAFYVDLDGFKHVNDNHGHEAGDTVLRATAARLLDAVRSGDFVGRIGGDEFLVVTEEAGDVTQLVRLGERLVANLSHSISIGAGATRVGASVGIAVTSDGEVDADSLLRDADLAGYRAKAAGRGRVELFDEGLREEVLRRSATEQALRDALADDALELHFQPVFDAARNDVAGVEALLRWNRPGFGMVPPVDFIPIAEASDLIIDVDRWVLRRACQQLAAWRDDDVLGDLTVAVNLSGRHLLSLTVVDDVRDALETNGVPPERLTVEITETVLLTDVPVIVEHLKQLRALGVRVAIDDFGTGYTSLTHLRSLPVDVLKIDRSLVVSGGVAPDVHVLGLLAGTAHALGLRLVAEGVETDEQFRRMQDLGCDDLQGYLISRPVPADALRAFMAERAATPDPVERLA
jgi:diguanylate cyclase (GGDEF)-like protein